MAHLESDNCTLLVPCKIFHISCDLGVNYGDLHTTLALFLYVTTYFFFGGVFKTGFPLYSSGHPGTHSVDQAGLELRNLPSSASQVLGLKACENALQLDLTETFPQGRLLSL